MRLQFFAVFVESCVPAWPVMLEERVTLHLHCLSEDKSNVCLHYLFGQRWQCDGDVRDVFTHIGVAYVIRMSRATE